MKITNYKLQITKNFKIKISKFKNVCYLVLGIFLLFGAWDLEFVYADNMKSDNYEIQMGNFNMTGGKKSSTNYKILDTMGQTAPGKYTQAGYIIKAGFPYIKTIIPFSFSISDLTIDFDELLPETPVLRTNLLTVSTGGASGYTVKAYENHPLQIIGGTTTINDTTCDDGACTQTAATVWWNDNTKYGFGFNIKNDDVPVDNADTPADFIDYTYFRHFANQNAGENPQTVMGSDNVGRNRHATVTYRANISGIQAAGNYDNIITFIATPGY